MLRKLRLKFVVLNLISIAAVLVVAFAAICYLDYQQSRSQILSELNDAARNAAMFADKAFGPAGWDMGSIPDEGDFAAPRIGGRQESSMPMAVYAIGLDGSVVTLSKYTTATISDDVLLTAFTELASFSADEGLLDDAGLYFARTSSNATMCIAFADVGVASNTAELAATLAIVGAAALIAFLIIGIFFSKWALRPVKVAWDQQKQFISDASHDLKTPLTVIGANTTILLEKPEATVASVSQWVESTQTEVEVMRELVDDMLDLARLDEGENLNRETRIIDLSDELQGQVLEFESVAYERNINLSSDIDCGVRVDGDPTHLKRLITTLIDNACKYVGSGGNVDIALHASHGNAVLSVANNGDPIPPDDLPHIFDRFYRSDKSRTRESGDFRSHGLGLAIARGIAEEHGGTIGATSDAKTGTVFTATLPLAQDAKN